jgi:diguanylate cyclase (GGDEF)-like protein/PAS domain S-box-containing protein
MLPDWINTLLVMLSQFTGTREEFNPIVVSYVMASVFYLFLFTIAKTRYAVYHQKSEQLLMWAFGLGLFSEVFAVAVSLANTFELISTNTLRTFFSPLNHALFSSTIVVLAAGYLRNYLGHSKSWLTYLKAALFSTFLIFIVNSTWWFFSINFQQISNLNQTWCDWLFHINNCFFIFLAIYYIFHKRSSSIIKLILAAFVMFAFNDLFKIANLAFDETYEYFFIPIANLSYLLALSTITYAYFKNSVIERVSNTNALKHSEAKLESMLKTINDLIWLKDPQGVYLACNAAFEKLYGAKESEIVGKTDYDFVDKQLADFFREHDKYAVEIGRASTNEEWLTFANDGHRALVETTKTPMYDQSGELIGVLGVAHDITERKNMELRAQQYEKIVQSSLDAIISKNLDGTVTSWNEGAEKIFGYNAEEMIGASIQTKIPPEKAIEEQEILAKIGRGEHVDSFDTIRLHKNGKTIYVSVTLSPIFDHDYNIIGASKVARDISERIRANHHIKRITQLYKALTEINQAIVRMEREEELFPLVCRCAVEFGGLNMAWVGQLDTQTLEIKPVAMYGDHLEYLDGIYISADKLIPEGQGPVGNSLRDNKLVVFNDITHDDRLQPWEARIIASGWNSICTSPINRGGKPFAVLCVYHSDVGAFDDEIISLLKEMSVDISFALDNFDREVMRKVAEESQKLAASVYAASGEAIVITSAERTILDVNPAFCEITGYTKEEIQGKKNDILRSPDYAPGVYESMIEQVAKHGKWQGEIFAKRKNGESFPIWLTINSVFNEDGSLNYRVSLFTDITHKKASEELIWTQANLDILTGLPNRHMFNDRLEHEISKSKRSGLPLALLFLDLDRFKEVNDTLGHSMGDILLKITAQRLKECTRKSDTVARLGGDEFTIILNELEDISVVYRVTESILNSIEKPFQLDYEQAYVSASIGITFYPDDASNAEALIKNSDQAMYDAKNAGRNRISFFTRKMQKAAEDRMRLANELHHAMSCNEIWVAYQPIIDLKTGHISKAEALARWDHPLLGSISPSQFIPIAEQNGLIVPIGDCIFKQVLHQVKHWQETYHPEFQISVNKSPIQIQDKHKVTEPWPTQLKNSGLSGKSIIAEITEGLLLENNEYISEQLFEFRDAGIQVALDDFGTGYSSLSYLQKFDIDYIKIDKSFVHNLDYSQESIALCEAIIVMAHKLGLKVVAEGIETEQQNKILQSIDCDFGQGYLFYKPMTAEMLEKLLQENKKFNLPPINLPS